jgi:hypothetical protein
MIYLILITNKNNPKDTFYYSQRFTDPVAAHNRGREYTRKAPAYEFVVREINTGMLARLATGLDGSQANS